MSADSEILGNHGALHSFDWNGKTWPINYFDRKRKTEFEKHLFKKARQLEEALYEEGDCEGVFDTVKETQTVKEGDKLVKKQVEIKKAVPPEEEYQRRLEKLKSNYVAGKYAVVSENGLAHLLTPDGQLYLTQLMIGCTEEEALQIIAAKPVEVPHLINLALEESLPVLKKKKQDPNPEAPAA